MRRHDLDIKLIIFYGFPGISSKNLVMNMENINIKLLNILNFIFTFLQFRNIINFI